MEVILANTTGRAKRAVRNGREYLVAPVVLIVPGVLNGSAGPLYYPPDEVAKSPDVWNDIPAVVYHPVQNGRFVSGRQPVVLDAVKVGRLYNAGVDERGRLGAEVWFDVERAERVDPRVPAALRAGTPLEISTGLFTENHLAPSGSVDPKGKPYVATARNYRPDHLAVLPDQTGACSVEDGCGVFATNSMAPGVLFRGGVYVSNALVVNPYANEHACRVAEPDTFKKDSFRRKEIAPGVSIIVGKKPGSSKMVVQSYRFDADKFTPEEAKDWLKKHDVAYVAFEAAKKDARNSEGGAGPSIDLNSLDRTTLNPTPGGGNMPLTAEQKAAIVGRLTANCGCAAPVPWKGKDAAALNSLSDDVLGAYDAWNATLTPAPAPPGGQPPAPPPSNQYGQPTHYDVYGNGWRLNQATSRLELVSMVVSPGGHVPPIPGVAPPAPVAQPVAPGSHPPAPAPGTNAGGSGGTGGSGGDKPKSMADLLQMATQQDREIWNSAVAIHDRQKGELIGRLVANLPEGSDARTQALAIYQGMSLGQLQVLVQAMPAPEEPQPAQPQANYFIGAGGGASVVPITEEPLLSPVYDFSRK